MRDDGRWTVDGGWAWLKCGFSRGVSWAIDDQPNSCFLASTTSTTTTPRILAPLLTYLASETAIMWGRVFEWEIGRDRLV